MNKHRAVLSPATALLVVPKGKPRRHAKEEQPHGNNEGGRHILERIGTARNLVCGNDTDKIGILLEKRLAANVIVARRQQLDEAGRQNVDDVDEQRRLRRSSVLQVSMVRQILPKCYQALVGSALRALSCACVQARLVSL